MRLIITENSFLMLNISISVTKDIFIYENLIKKEKKFSN